MTYFTMMYILHYAIGRKKVTLFFFNDVVLFLDQINNRIVDPRSLKFKRNVHGKPEVSFHLLFIFLKLIFTSYTTYWLSRCS